jgi:GNAT superfamily N-acetyltransferase
LDRRDRPYDGYRLELLPQLTRQVATIAGADGMVSFAELAIENVASLIDEQTRYFQELGQPFEWKVYDLDLPSTLKQLLEERGFRARDVEAFLVLQADAWNPSPKEVPGLEIRKISYPHQLPEYIAAERAIWESTDLAWHLQQYTNTLAADPEGVSIYCAYVDGLPVGTGRVTFPRNSQFADLNGGGVVPGMRGRGIFSALLSHRIAEAKGRGYTWLAVDAAPMSRPILLGKGFQHVCWTYPMFLGSVDG